LLLLLLLLLFILSSLDATRHHPFENNSYG